MQLPVNCDEPISVGGDDAVVTPDEDLSIPIVIKNNSGLMGFKITVEYPKEILYNPKVSKGNVTANGMLGDNIKEDTNGNFEVLWSHSEDVKENGVLFILNFKVKSNLKDGTYQIKLDYSQPDTFNEAWEDVILSTSNISITVATSENVVAPDESNSNKNNTTDSSSTTDDNQISENDSVTGNLESKDPDLTLNDKTFVDEVLEKVDSKYLEDIIDDALKKNEADDFSKLRDNQFEKVENQILDSLDDYGISIENKPESKQAYQELHKEAIIKNKIELIKESANIDEIVYVIEKVLKDYKVNSITDIAKENEFVDSVINELNESGLGNFSDTLNNSNDMEIIKRLFDENKKSSSEKSSKLTKGQNIEQIVSILIVSIVIIISGFILIKLKKKEHK